MAGYRGVWDVSGFKASLPWPSSKRRLEEWSRRRWRRRRTTG